MGGLEICWSATILQTIALNTVAIFAIGSVTLEAHLALDPEIINQGIHMGKRDAVALNFLMRGKMCRKIQKQCNSSKQNIRTEACRR